MVIQFREISQSLAIGLLLGIAFVTSAGCKHTGSEGSASWGAGQLNGPQQARSERDFILSLQQALKAGDRDRILSFIRFPVRVGEGKTRADMDEDMFTRNTTRSGIHRQ